ncbi:hypothetical protein F5146DRAFT_778805 [Armillaria mellea]|nr:hypothetical protein F5146DRAFT_778805 [Armillaria mellea]
MSGEEGEDALGEHDRKHVSAVCKKRLNRPSSFRIRVNMHTAATPFGCPFTACNMRRHYRDHTNSSVASLVRARFSFAAFTHALLVSPSFIPPVQETSEKRIRVRLVSAATIDYVL